MAERLLGDILGQSSNATSGGLLGGPSIFQTQPSRGQRRSALLSQAISSQGSNPYARLGAAFGGLIGMGGRAAGEGLGILQEPEQVRRSRLITEAQQAAAESGIDPVAEPERFLEVIDPIVESDPLLKSGIRSQIVRLQRELAPEQPELPAGAQNLAFRAQQAGLVPGTPEYQEFMRTGGQIEQGADVNVAIDQRAEGALETEFAKQDAQTLSNIGEAGVEANRSLAQIDRLSNLLDNAPQGLEGSLKFAAGNFGIPTENLSEIQAAQALINQIVPSQREPGSGPMSDSDLELFKQSIVRLINQPEGNKLILDTMRGIAEYDKKGAEIVNQFREGNITRTEAFKQLSNRSNPLQNIGFGGEAAAGQIPVTTPDGQVFLFPTQEAANEFKQRIGID